MREPISRGIDQRGLDESFAADEASNSNLILEGKLLRSQQHSDAAAERFARAAEIEERYHARATSSSTLPGLRWQRWTEKTNMNQPIKFPSDADVIVEEVARFRALSAENRMRSIRGLLAAGGLMMRQSPRAEFLQTFTLEQETCARQAVMEFLTRHAGSGGG